MASCKVCGKKAISGAAVHSDCLERELGDIMAIMCGKLCRYPHIITDEKARIEFCGGCKVMRKVDRLTARRK